MPSEVDVLADRTGAADGASGPVEGRQEPVAERLDLAPAERGQLATHERIVVLKQRAPTLVAELRGALGRAGDVGEQHSRQHAVGLRSTSGAGQELLDLVKHGIAVAEPGHVVVARQLDEACAGNLLGDVAAVVARNRCRPCGAGQGSAR